MRLLKYIIVPVFKAQKKLRYHQPQLLELNFMTQIKPLKKNNDLMQKRAGRF